MNRIELFSFLIKIMGRKTAIGSQMPNYVDEIYLNGVLI
jgi:hypothetical protein